MNGESKRLLAYFKVWGVFLGDKVWGVFLMLSQSKHQGLKILTVKL